MGALDGRTALVTGASQGIGQRTAVALAEAGANVTLAARSDGIYETQDLIGDDSVTLPVETDITSESQCEHAIAETVDTFGGLDCLVNNSGIAGPTAPVEEVTVEEWEHTMDVNVTGMFRMVKHASPHLRASDAGSIVNLSSISGKRPLENRTPYTASKMAVIGLTRTLAFEFGEDDVTVNAICPGATRGARIDSVIRNQAEVQGIPFEEAKEQLFEQDAAVGRMVEPEDIADLVVYLAGPSGRHITAQDINVDGGTVWY